MNNMNGECRRYQRHIIIRFLTSKPLYKEMKVNEYIMRFLIDKSKPQNRIRNRMIRMKEKVNNIHHKLFIGGGLINNKP